MAKKQNPMLGATEVLRHLFSNSVLNYDAISEELSKQRGPLIEAREAIQAQIEWLSALDIALQANRLEWLQREVEQRGQGK